MSEQYPKDEFQQKMRAYLEDMRAQLSEIEAKLNSTEFEGAPEAALKEARRHGKLLEQHLQEVEVHREEEWEELRDNVEAAWDDLTAAMEVLEDHMADRETKRDQ